MTGNIVKIHAREGVLALPVHVGKTSERNSVVTVSDRRIIYT
jgi:hypothetical protein